jgi:hypothetical protein
MTLTDRKPQSRRRMFQPHRRSQPHRCRASTLPSKSPLSGTTRQINAEAEAKASIGHHQQDEPFASKRFVFKARRYRGHVQAARASNRGKSIRLRRCADLVSAEEAFPDGSRVISILRRRYRAENWFDHSHLVSVQVAPPRWDKQTARSPRDASQTSMVDKSVPINGS